MTIRAIKTIADATAIPAIAPTVSESESVSVVTANRMCLICQNKPIYILKHFVNVISEANTNKTYSPRLAPSLCISHSSKSDIHEIIMNPLDGLKKLLSREIQRLVSARGFSL